MINLTFLLLLGTSFSVFSNESQNTDINKNPEQKNSTRIDFDDARVQGQSIVAGAVYLSNRKKSTFDSMLRQRTSYRDEILSEFEFDSFSKKTKQ